MTERLLVLVCYFLSGVCGLVYEVVWMRRLSLTFGITVFATSTVLAAFMAGLALGSWLVSRRIDRSPNPVRVYAWLEIGIGLYALAVPAIFSALEPAYVVAADLLEGQFLLFNLARALLVFAALLLPTTLMGATVPAIGRYLVEQSGAVGWNVGLLYALNTFGAVGGCVAAGFWLVPALGMSRTTLVAAATNVAIGVVLLAARVGDRRVAAPAQDAGAGSLSNRIVLLAGLVFAISGFSALAYEVVWTRVLVVHVHNTTYAFTVMLAVFLGGLALGDVLLVPLYDRLRRPLLWLGTVEVLIGLSVVVAAAAYVPLRAERVVVASWESALGLMIWRAGLVLLPGALLFGMTFPLTARVVCLEAGRVGRALGMTYAANTMGAIGGSLAGGFLLIPFLGLHGTLVLLSVLNIGLGALCWLAATRGAVRVGLAAVALALVAVPWRGIPARMFFEALETREYKLIYYREGVTDTTGVWESKTGEKTRIVTYGDLRGTAGTHTDRRNRIQAHVAHLLHPNPRRSLQICFGVGNTLAAAALHPEVERLDCVELSPHVRETAEFFWTNANVLADPRVRLIVDDGRNFLLRNREPYDVITLEPPDIYTAGVVNLYTEEFYRLAARSLADDGLLCQWLPVGEMSEVDMRMLVQAFVRVFPETSLWEEGKNGPLLLVGTKAPLRIDATALIARMKHPRVQSDLARIGMPGTPGLFELFIAGPAGIRRWLGDIPAVTDDLTVVDFATPKRMQSGFGFGYFRLKGAEREAFNRHIYELQSIYGRFREPIESMLLPAPAKTAAAAGGEDDDVRSPSDDVSTLR